MTMKAGLAAVGLVLAIVSSGNAAETTPPSSSSVQGDGDLSGKLGKSGGVIKPIGDVDPAIQKKAPVTNPNSTPVIPPSATGGQNAK